MNSHMSASLADVVDGTRAPRSSDRLRAAEVEALYSNVTIGVLGAGGAAMGLAASLTRFGGLSVAVGAAWVAVIWSCALAHVALRIASQRSADSGTRWRFWAGWFTLMSLAEGLSWGWASIFLVGNSHLDLQLCVFVVCFGVAAGAVPAFGSYLPAFWVFFIPATVPEFLWSLDNFDRSPQQTFFVALTAVFILGMGGLALRSNRNFKQIVRLRIHADELAADLRLQRDAAEQASLAKTRFLAAASHDLRQPVHALGLFVGALRNLTLPSEGMRLVEQIEASTLALDGLFGALLDMSRLDAGVVDVQVRAFAIDDLLERICRDHAREAAVKSLGLRRVPCSAAVSTDPVLMERVLRNLLVNAVRHTRRGRILVGCRRRGERVTVQVWDTGPGIPLEQQQQIFDEFVQLDNPERDRVKGLGLGLAIVRRLCGLLDCPVALESKPGYGSCFAVSIPVATGRTAMVEPKTAGASAVRERGLILVVDDEAAIQDGMARLLTGWGYAAIGAGSGDEMLAQLATCPDKPDLIIADYRLRGEEKGSDVIERLQSEYNETIPAILITGDTAPDRIAEAQASGFLLLHKPVPNGKLRAAIMNLIARSKAQDDSEEISSNSSSSADLPSGVEN